VRLSLADDDFEMPGARPEPLPALRERSPSFAPGEALALALALRFQPAGAAAMSALDLDGALSRLSTAHLQALLSLLGPGRPTIVPPASTH
jgi:hypothetical protein